MSEKTPCIVQNGQVTLLKDNPDPDCALEEGAVLRIIDDPPPIPEDPSPMPTPALEVKMAKEEHKEAARHHEEPPEEDVHEEIQVPDPSSVADLSQFTELAGDNASLAVIMSLIAVAGGGAAWKFYSQASSQKHEREMARIEKESDSHQSCELRRAELQAKVDALERKISSSIDLDAPSTTDLEKRIKSVERKLRELPKTPKI